MYLNGLDDMFIRMNKERKQHMPDTSEFVREYKDEFKENRIEELKKIEESYSHESKKLDNVIAACEDDDNTAWLVDVIRELPSYIKTKKKLSTARYELKSLTTKTCKASISNAEIEFAKSVKLTSLIECYPAGIYFKAKCPFHNEDNASFTIYPTNTGYCHGCHVFTDTIGFIRKKFNLSFIDAVKHLN